jgi:hypothetical protein
MHGISLFFNLIWIGFCGLNSAARIQGFLLESVGSMMECLILLVTVRNRQPAERDPNRA